MLDCIYFLYNNIHFPDQADMKNLDIAVSIYTHAQGHFPILACRPIHSSIIYWLSWISSGPVMDTNLLTQAWQPSTVGHTVFTGGSIQSLTEKIRQYDQSGIPVLSSHALSHAHCLYPTNGEKPRHWRYKSSNVVVSHDLITFSFQIGTEGVLT